ncbi:exported hypothetical protein [Candidatus Nitrospira nitrosa]|uniref:Secreted protein n=1 Tax=Candidatus Nitrospira nitrosa TaxID=1742972 RepID=A0A0S4LAV0_9BACT|nr:hypothetical protein [Candidatus Nitrospira nitrosa]CUS32242.1 exported hypothetical protein [Candidatus Nitrospira nitrosa]
MYHLLVQIFCNALATLVFGALLFFAAREANATHCPGCDTTEPSYGSSSFENRREAGKYQPGDGRTPYEPRESSAQRYERERQEQERSATQERQERDRQEQQRQQRSSGNYGY